MNNVLKTGSASPCTPKSTNQNLSTSSISTSQDDKKTNVHVSPNYLALPMTPTTYQLLCP